MRKARVLLVEDNPDDVFLTKEAFKENKISADIDVLPDGENVINYLSKKGQFKEKKTPDLILLDLNLPGKDGRQVLKEIKSHKQFRVIPVIILTTSQAKQDISSSYYSNANSYIQKPMDFDKFSELIRSLNDFWFKLVKLPND